MDLNTKAKNLAPIVLRIGLSLVFIWFGYQQLAHVNAWMGFIPDWVLNVAPVSAETLVYFNGSFEVVFGLCLLFGFFIRISALLLALHMINITLTVGYDSIGVRDFGLAIASISMFLLGESAFSVDSYLKNRKQAKIDTQGRENTSFS
jgi:putative oxidoreductase